MNFELHSILYLLYSFSFVDELDLMTGHCVQNITAVILLLLLIRS